MKKTTFIKYCKNDNYQVQGLTVVTLLFAAMAGDVTALHRHYLQVVNMIMIAVIIASVSAHSIIVFQTVKACFQSLGSISLKSCMFRML